MQWAEGLKTACITVSDFDKTGSEQSVLVEPAHLRAGMAERMARTPGQIAFWQHAQGDDWEAVIEADTDLLLRIADRGGRLAPPSLETIAAPVLFTATLDDTLLPNVAAQLGSMTERIPDARLYLTKGGGHPLMWSKPDEFRAVCDLFLRQLAIS